MAKLVFSEASVTSGFAKSPPTKASVGGGAKATGLLRVPAGKPAKSAKTNAFLDSRSTKVPEATTLCPIKPVSNSARSPASTERIESSRVLTKRDDVNVPSAATSGLERSLSSSPSRKPPPTQAVIDSVRSYSPRAAAKSCFSSEKVKGCAKFPLASGGSGISPKGVICGRGASM